MTETEQQQQAPIVEAQADTSIEVLSQRLDSICATVENVNRIVNAFEGKFEGEERKREYIESLFTDKERFKDDFFFDIIKPLLMDIIQYKDDLEKKIRNFDKFIDGRDRDAELNEYIQLFRDAADDVADILETYDVEQYKSEANTPFDPLRQKAVIPIPTDDVRLFKIIAHSLSHGYERRGAIISKERVSAYVYKEPEHGKQEGI